MHRFQPYARRYFGPITIGTQPTTWIRKHRSFASREWLESQVRYGQWIRELDKQNYYRIYVNVIERIKPIKILIKIEHRRTHVLVCHTHVLRQKK